MTIKAIETRYAGCRFRSRLEARWAVFFDKLSMRWEYEPQGYVVGGWEPPIPEAERLYEFQQAISGKPYLPDFWLPEEKLWIEVKGAEADLDHKLILDAVIPHGQGLPHVELDRHSMLVLGPLPRPGGRSAHSALVFHKGDVHRDWAEFGLLGVNIHDERGWSYRDDDWLGNDSGEVAKPSPGLTETVYLPGTPGAYITEAYTAARSARFEHGETGR